MTIKARSRECEACGNDFTEARSDSNAQWEKRQFCSIKCNNGSQHRATCIFIRLERYQVKGDGCWSWSGAKDAHGYGIISSRDGADSSPEKAHRVSYEKGVGPIPSNMLICHQCDNPECTNPAHLFLGTQKDNMMDCAEKGRINQDSLLNLRPGKAGYRGAGPIPRRNL